MDIKHLNKTIHIKKIRKEIVIVSISMVIATSMLLAVAAAQPGLPPTPYIMKYGYVSYENGTACYGPVVNVSNLITSNEWQAETYASSNHYELMLATGTDVNASENLRFITYDNTSSYEHSINVTNHTVTEEELNTGGLFEFNLTLNHYCLNYYPDYPYHIQDKWNYSGAAVMQMWTDFKDVGPYTQDDLQAWGRANNTPADQAANLEYIDPKGMAETLNALLPEHFTVGVHDNTTEGLSFAMHRVCWWQYLGPGALPTDGYYAKWMSIRGIHTDKNPHEGQYGGYGDWGYNVSGFWINDPDSSASSIGANSYKTASEWTTTYYTEINDPVNTVSPYNWNYKYITVLEPPEFDFDVRIVPAKPRLTDAITPVLMEKALKVDGIERLALVEAVEDEDALDVVGAAIEGVSEELVPYDAAFAEVFAKTVSGEPMYVSSDNEGYYIVPFNVPVKEVKPMPKKPVEIERVNANDSDKLECLKRDAETAVVVPIPIGPIEVENTLVVVLVDAADGSFKEASWVADPVKYLPVSKKEALKLVFDVAGISIERPVIELVCRDSCQYYPDWKITVDGSVFYVSQDGTVS